MPGFYAYGYYHIGSLAPDVPPGPEPQPLGAEDLLGALKAAWSADPACVAAAPGGWHTLEGAVGSLFPYVTAVRVSGLLKWRSSSSNVDDVRVRLRFWSNQLGDARLAANATEALFEGIDGLLWTDGWSTRLERVDRTEGKDDQRLPRDQGLLRKVELVYVTHCGRGPT